jgi:hypothetical protein
LGVCVVLRNVAFICVPGFLVICEGPVITVFVRIVVAVGTRQ